MTNLFLFAVFFLKKGNSFVTCRGVERMIFYMCKLSMNQGVLLYTVHIGY